MHIDDCDLAGIGAVSMAPMQRTRPEDDWVKALGDGVIPASLYDLYCRANFLSFGSAPRFLADPENLLFSYFGLTLRCIEEALLDAHQQLALFNAAHNLVYDPMKAARGESWDPDASSREKRHFRDLLTSLHTALDSTADVIAIFFPGRIARLKVGKAQFARVEQWLNVPLKPLSLISSPEDHYLTELHNSMRPLVFAPGPETDWLPFMRLLHNKAAHLGSPLFRQIGLPRRGDGELFAFIPREWPYLWERLIKPAGSPSGNPAVFPALLRAGLIHQDIVSYAKGLLGKVQSVVAAATESLSHAYEQFQTLPENTAALAELRSSSERYNFEYFAGT